MRNFEEFLNENKSFPQYKVGDLLYTGGKNLEFQYRKTIDGNSWEPYTKVVCHIDSGALLRIVKIESEKKQYVAEFISGILRIQNKGEYFTNIYISEKEYPYKIYLRVRNSDKITDTNVGKVEKLIKESVIQPNDDVIVKISKDRSVTRKVIGIALEKSIEEGKLYYRIKGIENLVSINSIEKEELDLSNNNTAIELLAKEIGKITNTEITEEEYTYFKYDTIHLKGSSIISGNLFFKNNLEKDSFCKDLEKFINSRLDKNLQNIMNHGEPSVIKISNRAEGSGFIDKSKIIQAARNVGINIKEFLEKKKGIIQGKKYGI